ncbi:MAG: DNA-formamidopyrimidine glycosylase [Calditrichaceae bacterium]
MPELPEVETVAVELRSLVTGKVIETVRPFWEKSFQNMSFQPLTGQRIKSIGRKGKYLIFRLSNTFLIIHLRMTGQLVYQNDTNNLSENHLRVKIHFDDGSSLNFKDTRKFGRIYHVDHDESFLENVGRDALDPKMDMKIFKNLLSLSRMSIKAFLLSQKYISGLGNIYVDESLFRAGIHPGTSAAAIPDRRAGELFLVLQQVLRSAVKNMGTTISDYRDAFGNSGNNQRFLKVYGRQGLPCGVCGTPVKKIKFAGRGTHFCPMCQT